MNSTKTYPWPRETNLPEISDVALGRLSARYSVVVRNKQHVGADEFFMIETPHRDDRRGILTWNPTPIAQVNFSETFRSEIVSPTGYYDSFRPTKSEVLCQLPPQLVLLPTAANAFYINIANLRITREPMLAHIVEIVWGKITRFK